MYLSMSCITILMAKLGLIITLHKKPNFSLVFFGNTDIIVICHHKLDYMSEVWGRTLISLLCDWWRAHSCIQADNWFHFGIRHWSDNTRSSNVNSIDSGNKNIRLTEKLNDIYIRFLRDFCQLFLPESWTLNIKPSQNPPRLHVLLVLNCSNTAMCFLFC